jgi:hypothetical protein
MGLKTGHCQKNKIYNSYSSSMTRTKCHPICANLFRIIKLAYQNQLGPDSPKLTAVLTVVKQQFNKIALDQKVNIALLKLTAGAAAKVNSGSCSYS